MSAGVWINHYAGAGQGRLRGLDRSRGGGGCVLGVGGGAGGVRGTDAEPVNPGST